MCSLSRASTKLPVYTPTTWPSQRGQLRQMPFLEFQCRHFSISKGLSVNSEQTRNEGLSPKWLSFCVVRRDCACCIAHISQTTGTPSCNPSLTPLVFGLVLPLAPHRLMRRLWGFPVAHETDAGHWAAGPHRSVADYLAMAGTCQAIRGRTSPHLQRAPWRAPPSGFGQAEGGRSRSSAPQTSPTPSRSHL